MTTDPVVSDNRPGSLTCPSWLLLLDDPDPERVLVIGEDPSVPWFLDRGAEVEVVTTLDDGTPCRPADLVIDAVPVGGGQPSETEARASLQRIRVHCKLGGAVVIGRPGGRWILPALVDAGFSVVRPEAGPPRGRLSRKAGLGTLVAIRTDDARTDGRDPSAPPPQWLIDLTRDQPWEPRTGGWSLRTPNAYPSQKAVLAVGPGAASEPAAMVKVTRHARFNDRLDNEFAQLRSLHEDGETAGWRTPAALALGRVAGLAAVVEEAIVGQPFLEASSLTARCPLASDAVRAITSLARSTTQSGTPLAERTAGLIEQFARWPGADPAALRRLEHHAETIAGSLLPEVVFHGDLGTWNLMVHDGSVRILDWESAEPSGPPLWDLAYFSRSYAVRAGRRRGLNRRRAIERHLLGTSPLNTTIGDWMGGYARRIGLANDLLEPLFATCWLHRAVKERSRLQADEDGHYGPLCNRLVLAHDAPGLRSVLAS